MDQPKDRAEALALAARGGDPQAADELVGLMGRAMRSLARKVAAQTHGRIEFDEALGIVGLALSKAIRHYREDAPAKFTTFAITVMTNAAITAVRDGDPTKTKRGYSKPSRDHDFDMDTLENHRCAMSEVEREDLSARLQEAAGRLLEDRHRTVLAMRSQNLGKREIVAALGVSSTTAWKVEREARNRARIGIFASGDPDLVQMAVAGGF